VLIRCKQLLHIRESRGNNMYNRVEACDGETKKRRDGQSFLILHLNKAEKPACVWLKE